MMSESLLNQAPPPLRSVVSEWEDNILFDADDPDFVSSASTSTAMLNALLQKVPSNMSLDMQKPSSYLGMNNLSVGSSLSDLAAAVAGGSPFDMSAADNVLTIEELRAHMGSCFTCGVSWTDDHVSLDCSECGGYSAQRPCPLCDGKCGVMWKRDFSMSHACSKARWIGRCPAHSAVTDSPLFTVLPPAVAAAVVQQHRSNAAAAAVAAVNGNICSAGVTAVNQQQQQQQTCGASQFLAHDLCVRLERLSASAQT